MNEQPAGAIHDIGYRHYEGPRHGASYVRRSLFVDTFRGAFGLGRSARSKVMPFLLLGVMVLPAVIIGIVTGYFGFGDLPLGYTDYVFTLQVAVIVFLGSQAPAAMSRDLRFRVAPLYFSRPLSRQQYVQAKYAGMTAALLVVTALPLTMLLAGALLAELPLRDQLPDYLRSLGGAVVLSLVLAGIGLVVAAMTPRRGLGVAAVVGVLLVLTGIQGTVRALVEEFGSDTAAGYVGLISPFTLVDGVVAGPLGGESVMATPPEGALTGAVFCLAGAALVAAAYGALVARYRRALS
ncbi:ABC transporter permease [Nocardioides coralli]|uniref:ABC transporter permease n=1 Tax=Nocardioides coralli TaxID=2872154 RepID=UPI001CA388C8|nr:ABC transporter permease [Nocardioides coralli]QZY29951.1 ABC transporter permease [Nocardioides coralli]